MRSNLSKLRVHYSCILLLEQKINKCLDILKDLDRATTQETKSSAGDKYETSREMMRQETDKIEGKIGQLKLQLSELKQLDPSDASDIVTKGSLVRTDVGIFYIAMALGKVTHNELTVMAISLQSPMGIALMNQKAGTGITVNDMSVNILEVS